MLWQEKHSVAVVSVLPLIPLQPWQSKDSEVQGVIKTLQGITGAPGLFLDPVVRQAGVAWVSGQESQFKQVDLGLSLALCPVLIIFTKYHFY